MSFETLRQVKSHNAAAREQDAQQRQAQKDTDPTERGWREDGVPVEQWRNLIRK